MDGRDTGKVECRTGGYRNGGMEEIRDARKKGCRKAGVQERRDLRDEGCKFGSEIALIKKTTTMRNTKHTKLDFLC